MTTSDFLSILKDHPEKELVFEYREGSTVAPGYHITEVKTLSIQSVDCGRREDAWTETVVQLWENPAEGEKSNFMTVYKALGILGKVDRVQALKRQAPVKIEYGNAGFHTAQLPIATIAAEGNHLMVRLYSEPTDCKAREVCGTVPEKEAVATAACDPASGCCS